MHSPSRKLFFALAAVWLTACSSARLPTYPIEHPANPEAPMAQIDEPAESLTSSRRPAAQPADAAATPPAEHHHEKH
ncbi:MAG: hypothetical protein ACKVP2_06900 [Burkholderiales bacterium]